MSGILGMAIERHSCGLGRGHSGGADRPRAPGPDGWSYGGYMTMWESRRPIGSVRRWLEQESPTGQLLMAKTKLISG